MNGVMMNSEDISVFAMSEEHLEELLQAQERYQKELQEEQIIEARIRSLSLWEFIKIKLGR